MMLLGNWNEAKHEVYSLLLVSKRVTVYGDKRNSYFDKEYSSENNKRLGSSSSHKIYMFQIYQQGSSYSDFFFGWKQGTYQCGIHKKRVVIGHTSLIRSCIHKISIEKRGSSCKGTVSKLNTIGGGDEYKNLYIKACFVLKPPINFTYFYHRHHVWTPRHVISHRSTSFYSTAIHQSNAYATTSSSWLVTVQDYSLVRVSVSKFGTKS